LIAGERRSWPSTALADVLVRYLTDDQPEMVDRAQRLLEQECTPDRLGFVNAVVLCEVAWVLRWRSRSPEIRLHAEVAELAVKDYRSGEADFTDALIGLINRRAGCNATATSDDEAAELDSFRLL
jgi:predicted nucleic-acid-binding protein